MYKIFLDQNKFFQCNVAIEGASLNESEARLYLEAENFTLTFKGDINSDGTVKIPIAKLKGILTENYTGKIYLEVIAEDTVFKPWQSEFTTDISKKVKVDVQNDSRLSESFADAKPKMLFTLKPDAFDTQQHIDEINNILKKNNVSKKSLLEKRNEVSFNKLVDRYCSENYINDLNDVKSIKRDLIHNLR